MLDFRDNQAMDKAQSRGVFYPRIPSNYLCTSTTGGFRHFYRGNISRYYCDSRCPSSYDETSRVDMGIPPAIFPPTLSLAPPPVWWLARYGGRTNLSGLVSLFGFGAH